MKNKFDYHKLAQQLKADAAKIGTKYVGKLYHGSNNPKQTLTKDSCFTDDLEIAKEYAYFWAEEVWEEALGSPCILVVEGEFIYNGAPDCYKLVNRVDIIEVIKLPSSI